MCGCVLQLSMVMQAYARGKSDCGEMQFEEKELSVRTEMNENLRVSQDVVYDSCILAF